MKTKIFMGAGVAIVTPFNEDLSVNYIKLGELIEFQIAGGTDAIIICGTTGEASTLTDEEHRKCIAFAVKKAAGRIPVIAGTGSNDTAYAIDLSQYAEEVGADGILSVTPYYNKTSQAGLVKHFEAIASSVSLPIILYNVPSRTGLNIAPDTYLALSKIPNIVATKEANGNISEIAKTAALCKDDLFIYSGNDDQIVPILALGGIGIISVLSNIAPQIPHKICKLYFEGKTTESAAMQLQYLELINAMFVDVNPVPVKYAMNVLGKEVGSLRLPLCDMSEKNQEYVRNCLSKAKL